MKGIAGLITVLLLCSGSTAAGSGSAVDYRIAQGPLGEALNHWATQSGVQLVYPPQLVARRSSTGLSGRHSPREALQRLLDATGIEAAPVGTDTFVLRRAAPVRVPATAVSAPFRTEHAHTQLPQVDVRGSVFGHIGTATATPVTTITREQIQTSGYLSLFDLLRSQPGVQVTRQPEVMGGDSSGAFRAGSSGASSVALRRLGASATLLLLNGRRLADYGLASANGGSVTDISSIPLAMVERIDIVRDGAGTIYGAEAMGGVIDITLRNRLDGGDLSILRGVSSRGDADHRQLSGSLGRHFANGANLLLMFDALQADPLLGDRRDWYTLDRRKDGLRDARSVFSYPGNWLDPAQNRLRARAGCAAENLSEDGLCLADTAKVTSLRTGKKARSLFGHVRSPLTGPWDIYADLRVARSEQSQQAGPSNAYIVNPQTDDPARTSVLYYGFWNIGPIRQRTQSDILRGQIGLERKGQTWHFDSVVSLEDSRADEHIAGLVNRSRFSEMVFANSYQLDRQTIDPAVALALAPPLDNRARTRVLDFTNTVSGRLDGWPAGPISVDAGLQWRRETLRQTPDASLASDELLITPLQDRYQTARPIAAAYGRLGVPLPGGVQADLGWRIEHDTRFGSHGTPSLGLLWTPVPSLLLRAGATRGWRTPALLEQRATVLFSNLSTQVHVPDSMLPCRYPAGTGWLANYCTLEERGGSNASLRPETSRGINAGVVWEPFERFSIALDIYQLRRSDEIGELPLDYALQHPDAFPGAFTRDAEGRLEAINQIRVNLGQTTTRGADLDLRWTSAATRYGTFGVEMAANWLDELSFRAMPDSPRYERAGYADQPRLTAMTSLRWSQEPWSATVLLRYTGNYEYRQYDGDTLTCPTYRASVHKCSTPPFTLVNATVAYTGLKDWRLSLGVANLFDHTPRYYKEASGGYNPQFDDPIGRYYWLSATRRF